VPDNVFQKCRKISHNRRESKNCKMQDITAFVVTAFQIHADTLGLYCNVNRQVMKLDRVSVFC